MYPNGRQTNCQGRNLLSIGVPQRGDVFENHVVPLGGKHQDPFLVPTSTKYVNIVYNERTPAMGPKSVGCFRQHCLKVFASGSPAKSCINIFANPLGCGLSATLCTGYLDIIHKSFHKPLWPNG